MNVLDREERRQIRLAITRKRVETLVPKFMEEHGIDMWVMSGGDGTYEPVVDTLSEETPSNRVYKIFTNVNGNYKKYENHRFTPCEENPLFSSFLTRGENVFDGIARIIKEEKPRNIALNTSEKFTALDACTHSLYEGIAKIAGEAEIVSAEALALDIMQIRLPEELEHYEMAARAAQELIAETYTKANVIAGKTTMADLHYFMVKKMDEAGLPHTWGPNVNSQRQGNSDFMIGGDLGFDVIEAGDLLHIDFGFSYLQLDTDMQYLAYVLKDGETEAPKGLVDGFNKCLEHQQIWLDTVEAGKTGNEARREIEEKSQAAGLEAMVYSHPVGRFVHGVGPCVGKFGLNGDIPSGEHVIKDNTCYAMEQNVRVCVPEWDNQKVFIFREEDVAIVNGKPKVLGEMQKELWLI